MKVFVTVLTYLFSFVVISCIAFIMVIILAGPHAGLLPYWLESVVVVLGWLSMLIFPVLLARNVWRRFTQRESEVVNTDATI